MQRLEVSGAVRFIYRSLGVKGLILTHSLVLKPQACLRENIKGSKGGSRRTELLLFCECLRDFSRPESVARNSRIMSET